MSLEERINRLEFLLKSSEEMVCLHLAERLRAENEREFYRLTNESLHKEVKSLMQSLKMTEQAAEDARRKNVVLLDELKQLRG